MIPKISPYSPVQFLPTTANCHFIHSFHFAHVCFNLFPIKCLHAPSICPLPIARPSANRSRYPNRSRCESKYPRNNRIDSRSLSVRFSCSKPFNRFSINSNPASNNSIGSVFCIAFHVSVKGEGVLDDECFGFGLRSESGRGGILLGHSDSLQGVKGKTKHLFYPTFPNAQLDVYAPRCNKNVGVVQFSLVSFISLAHFLFFRPGRPDRLEISQIPVYLLYNRPGYGTLDKAGGL